MQRVVTIPAQTIRRSIEMPSNSNWTKYSPHIETLINSFVPSHVTDNYPELIQFIRAYLNFLETTNESSYYQNALPQQRDIRTQEEEFFRNIEREIGLFAPREYEANPKIFYDRISELWRSKGSQEAIETFFRLFLNDTVQVRYPWDFVLKPSDGRWQAPQKLRVSLIRGNASDFVSKRVQQIEEYGFATVTRVERKVYADQTIFELTLLRAETVGTFNIGNRITTEDRSVEAEIYNSVSNIVITNPGTGYEVGDRIRLSGLSRISFEARVNEVNGAGGIVSVNIIDFGSGTTPNHIFDVQGSGQYYLDNFQTFQYVEDDREVVLGDNLDVSDETIEFFNQDYTLDNYFDQAYVGTILASASSESLVDDPVQTEDIIITPADPTDPLSFQVDSLNGSGATFSLEFSAIVQEPGYYDGVRGQLSEAIVLQDSDFYQKFSYEVVTAYPINQWIDPVKRHINPAGVKPFGLINRIEEIDTSVDILSNDVLKIVPNDRVSNLDSHFYTFTKVINECAVCRDDTNVLSEEDISFTKRLFNSAVSKDTAIVRLGPTEKYSDTTVAAESGIVTAQNYNDNFYFSSDYVGQSSTF